MMPKKLHSHPAHDGPCKHSHFDFSHIPDARLKKIATYAAVGVSLFLIASKLIAWLIVGSVSILSSLADSVLDALASSVNLFAVHHAMRPADKRHQFGYGKIEAIGALAQASIILASACFVFYEGIHHLNHPETLENPGVGIFSMLLSVVLTIFLVRFQAKVVQKTGSIAITADAMHYKADLYLNLGVLFSLVMTITFGWHWVDPIVGMIVATYILYTSFIIAKHAYSILMDHEISDVEREQILSIILSHPKVDGYHEFKTRTSGTQDFVQIHLEMDGSMTLKEAHQVALEVEESVLRKFPRVHLTIHQDPQGVIETHKQL